MARFVFFLFVCSIDSMDVHMRVSRFCHLRIVFYINWYLAFKSCVVRTRLSGLLACLVRAFVPRAEHV